MVDFSDPLSNAVWSYWEERLDRSFAGRSSGTVFLLRPAAKELPVRELPGLPKQDAWAYARGPDGRWLKGYKWHEGLVKRDSKGVYQSQGGRTSARKMKKEDELNSSAREVEKLPEKLSA